MVPCQRIKALPSGQAVLWDRLLESTPHPLHCSRASELFLEVLALQEGGTEIDWPSVYCAITTLTRLDKDCLQARLAVGCSESLCHTNCRCFLAQRDLAHAACMQCMQLLFNQQHAQFLKRGSITFCASLNVQLLQCTRSCKLPACMHLCRVPLIA